MIDAVVRLIAISFISILCVAALLFGVRQFGLSQPHAALVHPLLQSSPLLIIKPPADRSDYPSLAYFKDISAQWPKALFWIKVTVKDNGNAYVISPEQAQRLRMGRPRSANDQEKSETPELELVTLVNALPPNSQFYLEFIDPDPARASRIIEIIPKLNLEQRIIFTSPNQEPLDYLRREKPFWVFAMAPAKLMQLKLLSSLFIESIAKIKQDILVSPLNVKGQKLITKRLLDEIHRRHKIYILESNAGLDSTPDWLAGKIDGIATEKPEIFLEYFKK